MVYIENNNARSENDRKYPGPFRAAIFLRGFEQVSNPLSEKQYYQVNI